MFSNLDNMRYDFSCRDQGKSHSKESPEWGSAIAHSYYFLIKSNISARDEVPVKGGMTNNDESDLHQHKLDPPFTK